MWWLILVLAVLGLIGTPILAFIYIKHKNKNSDN